MRSSDDEVFERSAPNPGATRAWLATTKISRQVDLSVRERASSQGGSHFPPLLEVRLREVVVGGHLIST